MLGFFKHRLSKGEQDGFSEADKVRWEDAAKRMDQRAVYADWMCIYTIAEDGITYYSARVDLTDQAQLTDAKHINIVRHLAAERYPELAHIEPLRTPDDPDCSSCGGTGVPDLPAEVPRDRIICECGGLGWIPAGYVALGENKKS